MATFVPLTRDQMARRAAQEMRNGAYVNLGIGIPTLVANFVPPGVEVVLHSGNGILGIGPLPSPERVDRDLYSVGTQPATVVPGAAFFSTADAFAMARGGHLDLAIMGALQVSEHGDIANWMVPGAMVAGMGGAMDIAVGAGRLIAILEHVTRKGEKRILKSCTLPLTGARCVDRIITDLCVLDVTPAGLKLVELAPGVTADEVRASTEPALILDGEVGLMNIGAA